MSEGPRYIEIARVDQEIMARMILVDFTKLNQQDALTAANEMKDYIAGVAGAPASRIENQIERLNEQIATQATTIAETRDRNSALMKEGKDLLANKENTDQELALTQQKVKDLEARAAVCTHGDLQTKITDLEQRLASRAPEGTENLRQELEETEEQLRICGEERNEYRDQVKRVLALAGNGGNGGGNRGHKGSEILRFSGTDRRALRGWMAQLAMKIADEPGRFFNEQSKMRYAANRLEGVALNQIQPYIDRKTGDLKLESLEKLLDLLQLAFGDQDIRATANRELLKLKQKDREFAQYYAEFQRWVPDVDWNEAAQLEVLRQGLSEELKDSLQHCNIPSDLTEFVKMCWKETHKSAPELQRESQEDGQQGQRNTKPRATAHLPQTQHQQALWQVTTALLQWTYQQSRG